jgi:hypothetical protein
MTVEAVIETLAAMERSIRDRHQSSDRVFGDSSVGVLADIPRQLLRKADALAEAQRRLGQITAVVNLLQPTIDLAPVYERASGKEKLAAAVLALLTSEGVK